MPFTVHRTLLVGDPASVALNCCVRLGSTSATAGVTASGPVTAMTVNGLGEVALPSGAVRVIEPVVAPAGTDVTSRLGAASVTVADVPLKATAFCDGVALNPFPKIVTVAPTLPRFVLTN